MNARSEFYHRTVKRYYRRQKCRLWPFMESRRSTTVMAFISRQIHFQIFRIDVSRFMQDAHRWLPWLPSRVDESYNIMHTPWSRNWCLSRMTEVRLFERSLFSVLTVWPRFMHGFTLQPCFVTNTLFWLILKFESSNVPASNTYLLEHNNFIIVTRRHAL